MHVRRIATGGEGVATDEDGRVVFVAGALPGEDVEVSLTEEKKRFARGVVASITTESPDRRDPPCVHVADRCGGCDWQHVQPAAEPRLKVDIVSDALERIGGLRDPEVVAADPLPEIGYRTTVRMAVVDGRLGYHERKTIAPVPIDNCLVAHPLLDEIIQHGQFGSAREVTLRCGARTGERLIVVDGNSSDVRVSGGIEVISVDDLKRGANASFHEEVAGRKWRISAKSFFQTRPDGADALVDAVRTAAGDELMHARVVDAYCGVGLFAGSLVDGTRSGAAEAMGIEQSKSSVADAEHNLPGFWIDRSDVAKWTAIEADVVVADPSRAGLGPLAAGRLASTGAAVVVLVSCDAGSLGRDAGILVEYGFTHERSTVIDLFPNTSHVEVVTRFARR